MTERRTQAFRPSRLGATPRCTQSPRWMGRLSALPISVRLASPALDHARPSPAPPRPAPCRPSSPRRPPASRAARAHHGQHGAQHGVADQRWRRGCSAISTSDFSYLIAIIELLGVDHVLRAHEAFQVAHHGGRDHLARGEQADAAHRPARRRAPARPPAARP